MAPRIFISYSHDSDVYKERVLEFVIRLRNDGIDAWIDRFELAPEEGWPRWMRNQIEAAEFVILVCTNEYRDRFYGRSASGGRGVSWEGLIIDNAIYETGGKSAKFIPVVFSVADLRSVPDVLSSQTIFSLPDAYQDLCRLLLGQSRVVPGEVREPGAIPYIAPVWDETPFVDVTIGAWFDGVICRSAILATRSGRHERWTIVRRQDLPLHEGGTVEKGTALLNIVRDRQHVGMLMALERIDIVWLEDDGVAVLANETVASIRGPRDKRLFSWNPISSTFPPYINHAPPLGYRVWTRGKGMSGECIRILAAKVERESHPAKISLCLHPMRIPSGAFQVRAPISGSVELHCADGSRFIPKQSLCTISAPEVVAVISCSSGGTVFDPSVQNGSHVHAGEALLTAASGLIDVCSSFVGTFYRSPRPGDPPFVEIGDDVRREQTLCIVEALKLYNEIEAEIPGRVVEIVLNDGDSVEFMQVLMRVDCR